MTDDQVARLLWVLKKAEIPCETTRELKAMTHIASPEMGDLSEFWFMFGHGNRNFVMEKLTMIKEIVDGDSKLVALSEVQIDVSSKGNAAVGHLKMRWSDEESV